MTSSVSGSGVGVQVDWCEVSKAELGRGTEARGSTGRAVEGTVGISAETRVWLWLSYASGSSSTGKDLSQR